MKTAETTSSGQSLEELRANIDAREAQIPVEPLSVHVELLNGLIGDNCWVATGVKAMDERYLYASVEGCDAIAVSEYLAKIQKGEITQKNVYESLPEGAYVEGCLPEMAVPRIDPKSRYNG